jgi:hypothetical protein
LRSQLGSGAPDLAQLLPELRELHPDLPDPPSLEPENARFRLFEAATSFELAESRLLVLGAYCDVDPAIREPLSAAQAELAREPVTRTLSLGGLGEADVARFIELTTDHTPAAGVVETVHTGTEGNPLFVGEIVRLLAAEGRLAQPGPRLTVPQNLKEVIARRLGRPSAECKRVLSLASVLGREFDLDVLATQAAWSRTLSSIGSTRRSPNGSGQLERCVPFFESVGATAYVRRGEKLRSALAEGAAPA